MPTNHEVVAALPADDAAQKDTLRDLLVRRMVYALADSESATDLVAVDPDSGATILALAQFGYLFSLDLDDTTSAHDDITCLVSYEGKRYKRDGITQPYSVLDKDLTSPPVSSPGPSLGDAYLIYSTPSGDWAGQLGKIAIYTARGWSFAEVPIGFMVHVEDEDSYYHRDTNGDWVFGLGEKIIADNSLSPLAIINLSAGGVLRVVNQTTNSPPGSPTRGDAYIIGSSPTGAWSGHAGKIAISIDSGSFLSPITPQSGWQAYDISTSTSYRYTGSGWVPSSGSYTSAVSHGVWGRDAISSSGGSSVGYAFLPGTPPQSSQVNRIVETISMAVTAEFAGQIFEANYQAAVDAATSGATAQGLTVGLFVDSETNARSWQRIRRDDYVTNSIGQISASFEFSLADTSPHTISIIIFPNLASSSTTSITLSRRVLSYRARGSVVVSAGSEIELWRSTLFGNMTGGSGLAAVIDGVSNKASASSATVASATAGHVGFQFERSETINSASVAGSNNNGYVVSTNPSTTLELYGKQGTAPSSDTDGTLLGTITFTDTGNESTPRQITSSDTTTKWAYGWVRVSVAASATLALSMIRLTR